MVEKVIERLQNTTTSSKRIERKLIHFIITGNYSRFKTKTASYSVLFSITVATALVVLFYVSFPSVLAQNATSTPNGGNPVSSQGNASMVEKVSDKGNYRVQIMWNQSSVALPKGGFDMEIDFLNASAPLPTAKTVPPKQSAIKGETSVGASLQNVPVPSIIQPTVPVDSYDITIYSNHGKVLWNKVNQPVSGGRGVQRVTFANAYIGDITIQITNIKSGNKPPNSVAFAARVAQ
jgi:hypothetical protein